MQLWREGQAYADGENQESTGGILHRRRVALLRTRDLGVHLAYPNIVMAKYSHSPDSYGLLVKYTWRAQI